MNADFTLYKLIILFLLDKVDFPLTNAQITDFILEKDYTNYFIVQQSLAELVDASFINSDTIRNSSRYTITDEGKETLGFFDYKVSDAIKEDVFTYLKDNEYSLKDKNSSIAYYFKSDNGTDYIVNLNIKENNSNIVDLNLMVPSEDIAVRMCSNWQNNNQEIYAYLFKKLM